MRTVSQISPVWDPNPSLGIQEDDDNNDKTDEGERERERERELPEVSNSEEQIVGTLDHWPTCFESGPQSLLCILRSHQESLLLLLLCHPATLLCGKFGFNRSFPHQEHVFCIMCPLWIEKPHSDDRSRCTMDAHRPNDHPVLLFVGCGVPCNNIIFLASSGHPPG